MAASAAPGAAGPGMAAGGGPGAAVVVAAGPGAAAGGGGAAVKSGEERLKEMEAEMALFEQEVLGAPGPAPGDPLAPPPVLRPIIATNTYQQVQQSLEARAAAAATVPPLGTPPVPFVGPVSPQRPPILRPAFVPHVLQRPGRGQGRGHWGHWGFGGVGDIGDIGDIGKKWVEKGKKWDWGHLGTLGTLGALGGLGKMGEKWEKMGFGTLGTLSKNGEQWEKMGGNWENGIGDIGDIGDLGKNGGKLGKMGLGTCWGHWGV
uniref:Uncharacterized protein n=1 Tax=Taeniopygia guttata TaxID=59729 RepID=A0A674GLT4_TAEGU